MAIEFLKAIGLIVPILFGVEFIVKDFKQKQIEILALEQTLYSIFSNKINQNNLNNIKHKYLSMDIIKKENNKISINDKEIFFYRAESLFERENYENSINKLEKQIYNRAKSKTKK